MAFTTIRSRLTRWHILRTAGILLSLITAIMLASILPRLINDDNSDCYADCDGIAEIYVSMPLGANFWTLLWNGIVLILFACEHWYHPGADIAMDLCGWAINWTMAVFLLIFVGAAGGEGVTIVGVEWTGGLLTFGVGCTHLAFFIKACKDTHHIRMSEKRAKFMALGGSQPAQGA